MSKRAKRATTPKLRVRIPTREHVWEPVWFGGLEGWTRKYVRQNKWRVEQLHDLDDIVQDGYLVFAKIADRYPTVVEAPHFTALYKTAFRNMFWDLTRKNMYKNEAQNNGASILLGLEEQVFSPTELLLAEAPIELRFLMSVFGNDEMLSELRKPQRTEVTQPRRSLNQRICELLGFDADEVNLVEVSRTWLKNST